MKAWTEIAKYIGFTPEDEALLSSFWPLVVPHATRLVDHFYQHIQANPETNAILSDPVQVGRLKGTLARWMSELLQGPHDESYVARRQRVGLRHVQVHLEARYLHAAMQVMGDELQAICLEQSPDPVPTSRALRRVLALDLAIMTDSFVIHREQQSIESLQELLVTHLRTVVILVDAAGHVVAATRSTSQWLGGAPLLHRPWQEVLPPGLRAAANLDVVVTDTLAVGGPRSLPRVDVRDDAGVRSYRIDLLPLVHPLATLILEVEELTEVVALEGRLARSEALAQLGALSAAVAHELRNPLAGISGAIQVISRTLPKDAPYAPIMAKVEREIRRLDALVTDLLAFARPGAVRLRAVNLREPVQSAVDWMGDEHPELVVDVSGEGVALADPDLVQQILLNLLQNAMQAMELAEVASPRVRVVLAGGTVEVSDSGPGVPPELGERIFEPFTTTKARGTGLGLAICARSATAMGGTLRWIRRTGPGATFALALQPG